MQHFFTGLSDFSHGSLLEPTYTSYWHCNFFQTCKNQALERMQWSLLIQRSFAKNRSTEGASGVVWRLFWRVGHLFWVWILPWTWARAGAGSWAWAWIGAWTWAWAGTKRSHCLGWSKIARGDANAKLVIAGKNLMTHGVPATHRLEICQKIYTTIFLDNNFTHKRPIHLNYF